MPATAEVSGAREPLQATNTKLPDATITAATIIGKKTFFMIMI